MAFNAQIIDANTMFGVHPTHRLDMSVERLVRELDRLRISAALTLSTTGIFHNYARGNVMTLDASKANNRLIPVATVNPAAYFGTGEEMQALRSQGFRIVKLHPGDQGWALDSAAFAGILKQLAPTKMPVMINTPLPGDPSAVGRVAAQYTGPIILCSITIETLSEALAVLTELPNAMIETNTLHVPGALNLLAERVGVQRIIFGSGAPRCSIAASLYYVLNSELSDDDKARILGGNIKAILEAA